MSNDFTRECMQSVGQQSQVGIDDFRKAYCIRCLNNACVWAVGASHAFTQRAKNWKDELFINVNRASEGDPKYEHIRMKQFIPLENQIGTISSGPSFIDLGPTKEVKKVEQEQEPKEVEKPKEVKKTAKKKAKKKAAVKKDQAPISTPIEEKESYSYEDGYFSDVMLGEEEEKAEVVLPMSGVVTFDDDD